MELFTVNRYDADTDKKQSNENEILQKLLKKVEKRKRRHSETKAKQKVEQTEAVISEDVIPKEEEHEETATEIDPITGEDIINEDVKYGDEENDAPPTQTFEVLGEDLDTKKRAAINAVLPSWLAHPNIISTSVAPSEDNNGEDSLLQSTFLSPQIRGALKEMKITRLFPVQTAVVPWILEAHTKPVPFRPRDVCVSAPTGSGKTLAFAIPVVQILAQRTERKIRALVILPVAELALQVFRVFKKLCEKIDLNVCLLSNHTPLPLEKERLVEQYKGQWYSKVDIVVTTPGRLVEHLHGTEGFCLKSLKFLVIDEADRIMDAVFQNWLYHLHAHVPDTSDQLLSGQAAPLCFNELELACTNPQPHKLLFSATLSQDPEKLQNLRLFQPILFTSVLDNLKELQDKFAAQAERALKPNNGEFIGKYTTPAELTEKYCVTQTKLKPLTLYSLIKENKWKKFLCFTNSVEACGRLAFVLRELFAEDEDNIRIGELSGTRGPGNRSLALANFSRGLVNGLVCSDALARGIDVPEVDIVISYDPPRHITTYIHRIGRTARAGRPGTAITMVSPVELQKFNNLLSEVGKVITQELTTTTDLEESNAKKYQVALERLRAQIMKDKRAKILEMNRAKEMKELQTKDTSTMTLMEKLQLQATLEMHDKVDTEVRLGAKRNNISRKFKPKTITKKEAQSELEVKDKQRPVKVVHKDKKAKKKHPAKDGLIKKKDKKHPAKDGLIKKKDKKRSENAELRKQRFKESLKNKST